MPDSEDNLFCHLLPETVATSATVAGAPVNCWVERVVVVSQRLVTIATVGFCSQDLMVLEKITECRFGFLIVMG